jgi:hypothetical protein
MAPSVLETAACSANDDRDVLNMKEAAQSLEARLKQLSFKHLKTFNLLRWRFALTVQLCRIWTIPAPSMYRPDANLACELPWAFKRLLGI